MKFTVRLHLKNGTVLEGQTKEPLALIDQEGDFQLRREAWILNVLVGETVYFVKRDEVIVFEFYQPIAEESTE